MPQTRRPGSSLLEAINRFGYGAAAVAAAANQRRVWGKTVISWMGVSGVFALLWLRFALLCIGLLGFRWGCKIVALIGRPSCWPYDAWSSTPEARTD